MYMLSRREQFNRNKERNEYTMKNNHHSKRKRYGKKPRKKRELDDMDRFINQIKTYKTLKDVRVETITNMTDGWAYKTAGYFNNKLNTSQLRDIHYSFKKMDNLERTWQARKMSYNLIVMNIELKQENIIHKKFHQLLTSFFTIIDKESDEINKLIDLDKMLIFMDALVGYHKYFEKQDKNKKSQKNDHDETLEGLLLKINEEYLLNLSDNDKYVIDSEKISSLLYQKESQITIHQIRKVFNEFKRMQRESKNNWKNIEEDYYKLYPKLAYMLGRGLITNGYFNLLKRSMNIVNQGSNEEKIIKLNNFIKYMESIISNITYQKKLASF